MIAARSLPTELEAPRKAAVRRKRQSERKSLQTFLRGWIVLMALGVLVTSRFAAMAAAGYQVDRLTGLVGQAKAQNDQLQAQAEALGSAGRLAVAASHQGLIIPDRLVVLGRTRMPFPARVTNRPVAWQVAWSQMTKGMASLLGDL